MSKYKLAVPGIDVAIHISEGGLPIVQEYVNKTRTEVEMIDTTTGEVSVLIPSNTSGYHFKRVQTTVRVHPDDKAQIHEMAALLNQIRQET